MSLEWKLPAAVCALLLAVSAALFSASYLRVRQSLRLGAEERLQSVSGQLVQMLQAQTRTLEHRTHALVDSARLRSFLADATPAGRRLAQAALTPAPAESTIIATQVLNPRALPVATFGAAAESVSAFAPPGRLPIRPAGPDSASVGEFQKFGARVVYPTVALIAERGRPLGYLVQWRRLGTGTRAREQISHLIGSEASFIVGSNGGLWTDQSAIVDGPPVAPGADEGVYRYRRAGESRLAALASVGGVPWRIAVEFPERAVFAPARTFLVQMSVVAALLIAAGFAGMWYVSRRLTSPLRQLTEAADAMGSGDTAIRVLVKRNDELGRLGAAFNHMAEQVDTRKTLEAQLRQAQKMEAVGRLAGGVAHDFNNLLTAIMSYAELIRADLPPDNPSVSDVDEIVRTAKQAHGLTRQLLAFSRQSVLQPVALNVNKVVEEVERMLRRLIGEDINLVTEFAPDVGKVRADAGQIEQVMMNLAVNARDAMKGGGTLTIRTSNADLDETDSRLHGVPAGGHYVVIAVSDTGVGMNPETQARIFEPFYTTKQEGTGLGLATVYGIVKQAGGHIAVYSEPGVGSTFRVYLPRLTGTAAEDRAAAADAPAGTGSETILLVEDDAAVRTVTAEALERQGYKVLSAHGPDEAIALASRRRGPLDLVVTDVVMPAMNGPTLVSRLRAVRPDLKLLFMSGYPGDAIVHHGLVESGVPFIEKPFTLNSLASKVREALRS